MAIQGFFTGDVKIRDLNGVLKAVNGIVEVATDAGTVTSVGLTVGSSGTDVNVANSPITTSGSITLNLPTASATNRGLLSSADWTTFNSKQGTITLTTTGSSGAATLIGTTLNIPNYGSALSGYVPYTGATGNVDLGEFELKAGQLTLDVSPTGTAAVGTTRWNNTIGSSETTLKGGSVILKNGVDLVARVVNKVTPNTTLTKANYPAVRVSGAQGQRLAVAYAQANNDSNSADTIGLVTETIATNQEGFIMTVGQLEGINTTGSLQGETWADGDVLYLSPTTPGALTNIKPTGATGHIVVMGYVEYAHANNGAIYVKVMNGWELDELHNVYISSVANNQGLFYESSTQLWKNKSIATVLGYTPANAATTLTINGTTYDISANRTWNVGTVTSIGTSGPLTGGTITGSGTIGITQATTSTDGYLSSTDWNTFNSKQAALTFSAPLVNTSGTISIPAASASVNGYLSSTDWVTFNNKQAALNGTGFVKISGTTISYDNSTYYLASNPSAFIALTALSATAPLSYSNTTGVFSISQSTTSTDGYLSSTDWNTFNNKQAAGSYITALTGEATASGPGSASVTLSTSAVTGKLLTGLNLTGGGTIAATDSILQAFGKVQNQISGMVGGVTYQGTWNASTNTPTLTSSVGTKGYYYIVDVAGSTNLNGITDWKIGDWAIFNGSTWDKVDNTDAVSSVNGFTGAVSLTTSNISEGTNLYYLDSRARLALSFTAGSGAYDNTTGVITIPTNTSQLTNGANFITLSSLSASSPLAYNNGTGAFSIQVANGSQNGYLSSTDWTTFNSKQNTITLTTTGSSGSSTLVGATLNVPTYTLSGLGGVPTSRQLTINGTAYDLSADRSWSVGTVTGSGTTGYVSKWSSSTAISNSLLYDNGSAVLLGTATAGSGKFMVYSTTPDNHYQAVGSGPSFRFADTITSPTYTGIVALSTATNQFLTGSVAGDMVLANNTTSSIGNFLFGTGATERMRISPTGNVSINNTNNTYTFDVTGTVRFTGQLRLQSTITDGTNTYTLPSATGTLALTSQIPANPVGGTGTTNYIPKFTGTSTIGDSAIFDNSGNILIGATTNSEGAKLKIAGGYVYLKETGGADVYLRSAYDTNKAAIQVASASDLVFVTSNTTRLTLNASGNLGLGVTPSAWSAITALELANGVSIASYSAAAIPNSYLTNNAFYNGSNWIYKVSSFAATMQTQTSGGNYAWNIAPSGTAGNAISFTQAMTLNASGNLSVGNTNDTYKLDVSGTGIFRGNLTVQNVSSGRYFNFVTDSSASYLDVSHSLNVRVNGASSLTTALTIASTGAATFSSSVTATSDSTLFKEGFRINATTTGGPGSQPAYTYYTAAGSKRWSHFLNVGDDKFHIANASNSELFTIQQNGNVGIGTTSPPTKFAVKDGTDTVLQYYASGADGYLGMGNEAGSIGGASKSFNLLTGTQFTFSTGGSERMRITSGGNVGIGASTNPQNLLEVSSTGGSPRIRVGTLQNNDNTPRFESITSNGLTVANSAWLRVDDGGGFTLGQSDYTKSGGDSGNFANLSSEVQIPRITVLGNGNVGIGTTSPTALLHLAQNTTNLNLYLQNTNGSGQTWAINSDNIGSFNIHNTSYNVMTINSAGVPIFKGTNSSTNGRIEFYSNATPTYAASIGFTNPSSGAAPDGSFQFATYAGSWAERMRITSGGNVGIGTTSPIQKLQVDAATGDGIYLSSFQTTTGAANTGSSLFFGFNDGANNRDAANIKGLKENGTSGDYASYMSFATRANGGSVTERMRITSGGLIFYKGSSTTTNAEAVFENTNSLLSIESAASGSVAKDIRFVTSAGATLLERMRITSGGDIRITSGGTTNAATLELTSSATPSNGSTIAVSYLGSGSYGPLKFGTGGSTRMTITSGGNVEMTGTIQTGAPTNGTAQPWKLGNAVSGSLSTNHYIIVEINGTTYSIPALQGLP